MFPNLFYISSVQREVKLLQRDVSQNVSSETQKNSHAQSGRSNGRAQRALITDYL